MSNELSKITNITAASVVIEDIGVFLSGKGSTQTVKSEVIAQSKNFHDVKKLVRVDKIRTIKPMPIWPFIKKPIPAQPEKEPPKGELGDIRQDIRKIRELLSDLLSRPTAPDPEVVAAHMQVSQERKKLFQDGNLPLPVDDPMFIPSSIVPDEVEVVIKTSEVEITKDDFDGDLEALRKALKK